ncbi:MAG: response regulator [Leptospiraceae bacterium]|nr:response regulator [Leptospiraceae bacterium]
MDLDFQSDIKLKILLVEDEPLIAIYEKNELQNRGYLVEHALSGEEAIELIQNEPSYFDLILMDIDLGQGLDGTESAEKILEISDIPIVFLSSHTEPEIINKTEKITYYGYVVKNSGMVIIEASIKMAMKLYRAKVELTETKIKVEENEARLLEAQLAAKVGSWQTNLLNLEVIWSEETFQIFELDSKTFQASHQAFLNYVYPEDRSKVDEAFKKSYNTASYCTIEHRILTSKGNLKYVEERWRIIRDIENIPIFAIGTCQDITKRKKDEDEIKRQLNEKEILLKEVHHRIKNNILSIEALLTLHSSSTNIPEVRNALNESITQVQSIRVLYDKLLMNNGYQEVSIKLYMDSLIESLLLVFPESKNIKLEKSISDFNLPSKVVTNIGIIFNELMTNIFKYAFHSIKEPHIFIQLIKSDNTIRLTIEDNGIGINEEKEKNKSPGFGLTIVRMLTEQLKGSYISENDHGNRSILTFTI